MQTQLYRHFDKDGILLYVGISLSVILRLNQHKHQSYWFNQIATITLTWFATRKEAKAAEREAIIDEKPKYNIMHKPISAKRRYMNRTRMLPSNCAIIITKEKNTFNNSWTPTIYKSVIIDNDTGLPI